MLRVILLFSYASEILSQFDFINLNECKLTPEGTEYMGTLSKTKSNVTCLEWNSMTEQVICRKCTQILTKYVKCFEFRLQGIPE